MEENNELNINDLTTTNNNNNNQLPISTISTTAIDNNNNTTTTTSSNINATRDRYEEYMAATARSRIQQQSTHDLDASLRFQASSQDLLQSARTVRNMQSDFGGVRSLLKSLIDERERTSVENERLRGEIKRFKLDATMSRKKKTESASELETLRSDAISKHRAVKSLEEENRSIERRLDIANAHVKSTQEDLDHVNENFANMKIELNTLRKRYENVNKQLDESRIELQRNTESNIKNKVDNTRLTAKIDDIEQMNKTIKKNNENLLTQLTTSESRVKELESEVTLLKESTERLVKERETRVNERAEVESALQKVIGEINQIKRDHEKEKKLRMSTENSLERMRQEHERVSTLYEQSQSQIAETKSTLRLEKNKRKNAEETARTIIEGCEHKVQSQQRELILTQNNLKEARQESEETILQYEAINQDYITLQNEMERTSIELRDSQERYRRIEKEANDMARSGERRWKQTVAELKAERDLLLRESTSLREKHPLLEQQVRKITYNLNETKSKLNESQVISSQRQETNRQLREEIIKLQQSLKKAIVTAEESSSKRQKFEDGYRVKVIESRNMEEKLRLVTLQNVSTNSALKSTQDMLTSLQKEVDLVRSEMLHWREQAMKSKDDARKESQKIKQVNNKLMLELDEIRSNFHQFLNLSKSVGKGNDNMLSLMSSSSSNIGGNIGLNLDEYDGGEDDGGDIEYSSPFPK